MPAIQANREISVSSPLGQDVLLFRSMSGSEQLGRLSEYRVQLLSTKGDLAIDDVLGKPMGVHLELDDASLRHFNGIVTRFRSTGWHGDFATYEATVHPALWLLTRSSNCRIFQDLSVTEIVKQVCAAPVYGGLIDLSINALSGTYAPMPYCVQYRETDFNFVCRLLENAGIYFFFKHDKTRHTMVLADSYSAHTTIPGCAALRFSGEDDVRTRGWETVTEWQAGGEIQASRHVLNDFDFEKPASSTSGGLLAKATIAAPFRQPAYELFDYPGGYASAGAGEALARARIERQHGQGEQITASSNARGLFPGGLFGLAEHPREDYNRIYLVTGAEYELTGNEYASAPGGAVPRFTCRLTAIGKRHAYRPLPIMEKPVIHGPQTAMVVGKAGEEIWTDKYGRVKVQFHWDRLGKADQASSCWVRVAQGWAGKRWGAMFLPRIGQEVIVSFLEGDPDQPLVTGSVYNADNMPPYPLPSQATRSTIKSNSSVGGGGYNELRFEDKKGAEQFYVHAERDLEQRVRRDALAWIGGDRHTIVVKDSFEKVGGDLHLKVGGDRNEEAGGSASLEAAMNMVIKGGMKSVVHAGQTVHIKAGMNVLIDAGSNITLKAGAAFLSIGPAVIVGSSIPLPLPQASTAINAAVLAATILPAPPPIAPREADDGKK